MTLSTLTTIAVVIATPVMGVLTYSAAEEPACHYPEITLRGELALGEDVRIRKKSRCLVLTASSQVWPGYKVMRDGVSYVIGVSTENRRIRYISTQDPKFKTPENLTVASTLADALKHSSSGLRYETGWAYKVQLKSGWVAAFSFLAWDNDRAEFVEQAPSSSSVVSWYFRR
jgi:hypothetical protein